MSEKIRVITTKKDVPENTVSRKGFHLLNMGNEGTWLVDQEHPGYPGCVKKAIQIAKKEGDIKRHDSYLKLPGWKKAWEDPKIVSSEAEEEEKIAK